MPKKPKAKPPRKKLTRKRVEPKDLTPEEEKMLRDYLKTQGRL